MTMKNIEDVYRLSPRQRDVLDRFAAEETHIPASLLHFEMHGVLDDSALDRAVVELVRKHPMLRTAFFPKGLKEPVQVVRDKAALTIEREDRSMLSPAEQRRHLRARLSKERARGFTLAAAPLMRVTSIRLAPQRHAFVLAHHPILLDEESALRCMDELFALHRILARGETPPAVRGASYREYVAWIEQQDAEAAQNAFRRLRGASGPTRLDSAPQTGAPDRHLTQQLALTTEATALVQGLLRQQRITLDALIEGAWAVLLAQRTHATEVLFGARVSGRTNAPAKGESGLGRFAGVLPRRILLPTPTTPIALWLQRIKADAEATRAHALVAMSQIREWAAWNDGEHRFESVVAALNTLQREERAPASIALGLRKLQYEATPDCALSLRAELGPRLVLRVDYDGARFTSASIGRHLAHLAMLVDAIAAKPDQSFDALPRDLTSPAASEPASAQASVAGFTLQHIEALLLQHPKVAAANVAFEGDDAAGGKLVARVVPKGDGARAHKKLDFSMFYFADANAGANDDKYRIYLEGAAFADKNDFSAVWTPERHFHENGGLYPNPAVLSAALATITSRVQLRAGSVVVPLHHPLRIAEEWAVVDNLSKGRVGISIASGWVPNDFALAPHNYEGRRDAMLRGVEQVRALWAGETIAATDGAGNEVALRAFPRPIQRELPLWLTAAGSPETFERAGELGFNILTSIMAQSVDEAAQKIALYRAARARAGHDPRTGIVTMMVHTFVGDDADTVLEKVREPFTAYLRSHVALMKTLVESLDMPIDIRDPKWLDYLASFAFERYSRQGALLGTPATCLPLIEKLAEIDVDEVACLVDFGVDADSVIAAFAHLDQLRRLAADEALLGAQVLADFLAERLPTFEADIAIHWADSSPSTSLAH